MKKIFVQIMALIVSIHLIACSSRKEVLDSRHSLPQGFVYLHNVDPSIDQKIGFASQDNFVKQPLDGYEGNQIICTQPLADELKKAQVSLKKMNPDYSLKVLDAYRPVQAVEHIKRWADDPYDDPEVRQKYYPTLKKKDLKGKYIAGKRSSHSRGSTVDLVIIDKKTGKELDFGPDFFGDYVHYNYKGLTKLQKKNRTMLRDLMLQHNFKPYDGEFWHYTLKNEPYPDTYFDFSIRNER